MTTIDAAGTRSGRTRALRVGIVTLTVLGAFQLGSRPAVGVPVCNTTPIQVDIPPPPGLSEIRRALPYPSTIAVSGLSGTITDVDVSLNGVTHPFPEDLDVLLVAPDGSTRLLVMSDVGGNNLTPTNVSGVDLVLSDQAAAPLPANTMLTTGTFRPTDDDTDIADEFDTNDTFLPPAPTAGTATALSVFNGLSPNGTWSLYVIDDNPGPPTPAPQGLLEGWCIDITTSSTPTSSSTTSASTSTSVSSTSTSMLPSSTTSSTSSTSTSSTSTSTSTSSTSTSSTSTSSTMPTTTTTSTTSTTVVSPDACVAQLQALRAQLNSRVDALRAAILQSVPANQQAALLALIEGTRSQANAQLDAAIARCP